MVFCDYDLHIMVQRLCHCEHEFLTFIICACTDGVLLPSKGTLVYISINYQISLQTQCSVLLCKGQNVNKCITYKIMRTEPLRLSAHNFVCNTLPLCFN